MFKYFSLYYIEIMFSGILYFIKFIPYAKIQIFNILKLLIVCLMSLKKYIFSKKLILISININ